MSGCVETCRTLTQENAFQQLCRPVRRLIDEKGFEEPTEPQRLLIPKILEGKNVLLISATATGKTEAAMLPVLHQFLLNGGRQPGISIIYITPLRALNRDILDRMTYWCNKLDIRLGIRHGDTGQKERDYQRRSPPDMLITTPETLQAVLQGRTIKNYLKTVRWVIVDEIHELADNKRGSQLSLALERMRSITEHEPQFIGLSATIGTPEKVAQFLVGNERDIEIIQISALRDTQFDIVYPKPGAEDYGLASKLYTHPEVAVRLKVMKDLIEQHDTTLIFTNTRSTSEALASRFNVWDIDFPLSIHHGSLAKTSRIATETGLRSGNLKTVVCTSSLELGIDIGHIDLVIQYNSPRQVTRLLQRVGRSGHRVDETSRGVIIALNSDDALESMVIARRALKEIMEPIQIPEKPYDVLVNQLIAELLQRSKLYFLQAKNLFKGAYPYRDLSEEDILKAGRYMHDRFPRLAWLSEIDEVLIKPKSSRKTMYRYFFNTLSMIPDEKDYLIIDVDGDAPVGILQEAFVAEYAKPGVKFTLRGSPWKILNIHNDKIYVRAEDDPTGAIPSWVGEQIPVPLEVALEVGKIKGYVEDGLNKGMTVDGIASELHYRYPANFDTIKKAIAELVDHHKEGYPIPTDKRVVLEDYGDNVIIHANFGSLTNRTLARVIGHIISEDTGYPLGVQQDTYMIMTQTVGGVDSHYVERMLKTLASKDMSGITSEAVSKTGLFKKRLINVARKAGALSKFANFSNITLGRLMKSFEGTVIFEEAMKDTLRQDLDVEATERILRQMADGEIDVVVLENHGEVSPLGKLGVDSISMKIDIVPPEKMTKIILESAKARIYNETRVLACLGRRDWLEERQVKDYSDKLVCPICGSTEIGVFDRSIEEVGKLQLITKRKGGKEPPDWWKRGEDASKLVSMYGRRAAIIASAKDVNFTEAWDILAETKDEGDEFFERIVESERAALRQRFM
jgi:ATP-dependent Lhr-like helicase